MCLSTLQCLSYSIVGIVCKVICLFTVCSFGVEVVGYLILLGSMRFVLLRPDIGSLLLRCSPTAIIGGVAFVVVYAIYSVALRTDAHVPHEDIEVQPFRGHSDPPAAVVVVVLV